MDISMSELWLFVFGAVGWGLYLREEGRRKAADWFAKEMISNDKMRDAVVEQYKAWKESQGKTQE
jgi:hypothetical protein